MVSWNDEDSSISDEAHHIDGSTYDYFLEVLANISVRCSVEPSWLTQYFDVFFSSAVDPSWLTQ
jgi:hypothetical protein